jgi:hypothetical protein
MGYACEWMCMCCVLHVSQVNGWMHMAGSQLAQPTLSYRTAGVANFRCQKAWHGKDHDHRLLSLARGALALESTWVRGPGPSTHARTHARTHRTSANEPAVCLNACVDLPSGRTPSLRNRLRKRSGCTARNASAASRSTAGAAGPALAPSALVPAILFLQNQ